MGRRRICASAPLKNDPEIPTTDTDEIERLIERVKQGKLEQSETQLIEKVLHLFLNLLLLVNAKNMTMGRLRDILFGLKKKIARKDSGAKSESQESGAGSSKEDSPKESASTRLSEGREMTGEGAPSPKKPGHGGRPASDYSGAKKVRLDHPTLSPGVRVRIPIARAISIA